jgi:hypothetical protein
MHPSAALPHEATAVAEEMDRAFGEEDFEKGIQLLKTYGRTNLDTASSACDAIWELATSQPNAISLGNAGACEAVVEVVRAWGIADQGMAWNGCSAISNLALGNEANRIRLGAAGACELVVDVLRVWGKSNTDVAFYGCRAVSCLAKEDVNKTKLNELGALAVVLVSLETESRQAAVQAL